MTFDVQKKMSNRWQMLAGLTLQRHRGFDHSGTYTQGATVTACSILNDPNCLINRDDGSVFTDVPWVFNLSGSYMLPWWDIAVAAKYNARDGDPLNRTQRVLVHQSDADAAERDRARGARAARIAPTPSTSSSTCGSSKRQRVGIANLELSLDLFNVMNANHVLLQNEALGTTLGRPTRILTPRIIRLGVDGPVLGPGLGWGRALSQNHDRK